MPILPGDGDGTRSGTTAKGAGVANGYVVLGRVGRLCRGGDYRLKRGSTPPRFKACHKFGLARISRRSACRTATLHGNWSGEKSIAPHVNLLIFKNDSLPCEGEVRFSSKSGKIRFDERNTRFRFDGCDVKILEHTNIEIVVPVSWSRDEDNLVASNATAPCLDCCQSKVCRGFP
jgi:hypothetical protein